MVKIKNKAIEIIIKTTCKIYKNILLILNVFLIKLGIKKLKIGNKTNKKKINRKIKN